MSFAVNQVIGNYECLGIIDKPKVGITYKVRNVTNGEIESLRAIPGADSRDPESADRLLREIRIQARLSHPNIVEFHDAFLMDGRLVMTTEFVDGPTLAELCRENAMPPDKAIGAIAQVLDALEQAHALGIVHRGITAEHVTVARSGAVKVSGFDLAKPASDSNLTRIGTVAGDPRYISPEQVIGHPPLDARSDLYSVGVLLYQALTGKLPFDGQNDIDVLAAQVSSEPVPPSRVKPTISPEMDQVVLTALRKDPKERFGSARDFRLALAAVKTAQPTSQPVQNEPKPVTQNSHQGSTRRGPFSPPLMWGVGVAVIAAATILWWAIH
jgi:serine/threonine-protein kinase